MLCQRALNARRDLLTALQDMLQIMVHELHVPEKRPALHIDAVDLLAASGIEQIRQNATPVHRAQCLRPHKGEIRLPALCNTADVSIAERTHSLLRQHGVALPCREYCRVKRADLL